MPKGAERIRYAIYTRQSKLGLADFSSCDAQFQICRKHARQSKERLRFRASHHFKDEGYSGSTLDRPGMQRRRKVIDLGGLARVYAVALDRLSRNMLDAVLLLDEFEKAGVELRLVHQPDLDSTPRNRPTHRSPWLANQANDLQADRQDHGRRQMEDQKTWDELALADARIAATSMLALWQSLDVPSQMRILAQVVERIEFGPVYTNARPSIWPGVCVFR